MTVTSIKAAAPAHQSEMNTAWHIFCALAQYRTQNPSLLNDAGYADAVHNAHQRWADLFEAAR